MRFKELLYRLGWKVAKVKYLPVGEDLFADLRRLRPLGQFNVVFDIGANIGQSTEKYLSRFEKAHIHSFEPIASSYEILRSRFGSSGRVNCNNIALGSNRARVFVHRQPKSTHNSLKPERNIAALPQDEGEYVEVESLDDYCKERGIRHIDLVKVDTEGYEKEVLEGSVNLLQAGGVDFMVLEIGFNRAFERTAFFGDVHSVLSDFGYELYGIYDQRAAKYTKQHFLAQADVLFVRQSL